MVLNIDKIHFLSDDNFDFKIGQIVITKANLFGNEDYVRGLLLSVQRPYKVKMFNLLIN